ncbi:hypothetical protein GAGA_5044 [Paraglaciecola agarilytica NO2]|uniref:Energy transducer TonB n=1 Tax=Paraglaciecola agarilytica NO2 TaxID=1125747 RepID=A0ABQ0IEM7_9ALTE|nr:hypothetical protein GAGA_5044 [Paraglaciecola agarilytica NO2]
MTSHNGIKTPPANTPLHSLSKKTRRLNPALYFLMIILISHLVLFFVCKKVNSGETFSFIIS